MSWSSIAGRTSANGYEDEDGRLRRVSWRSSGTNAAQVIRTLYPYWAHAGERRNQVTRLRVITARTEGRYRIDIGNAHLLRNHDRRCNVQLLDPARRAVHLQTQPSKRAELRGGSQAHRGVAPDRFVPNLHRVSFFTGGEFRFTFPSRRFLDPSWATYLDI